MRRKQDHDRWPELEGHAAATRDALLRRASAKDLAAASVSRRIALGMIAAITLALWLGFSSIVCGVAFTIWDAFERSSWGWLAGVLACLVLLLCILGAVYVPITAVEGLQDSWTREQLRALLASNHCVACDYPKPNPTVSNSVICPECGLVYPAHSTPPVASPSSLGAPA